MPNTPSPYRAAQLRSRARFNRLAASSAKQIQRDLAAYARELAERVRALPRGASRAAIERTLDGVRVAAKRLESSLVGGIATSRGVSFEQILAIQSEASAAAIAGMDLPFARVPPITLLGQFEAVGGAADWRTLIRNHALAAEAEAKHIIRQAMIRQADPSALARALRPYVVGAEPFHKAFGPLKEINLQTIRPTGALKGAARRMNFNARRIAFSELHNARQEAELTAFAHDPLVYAIRWTLSTYRGPTAVPDECDALAQTNFYGLGPGVFPMDRVPFPPHPFDRCERVPLVLSRKEFQAGKQRQFGTPLKADPATTSLPAKIPRRSRERVRRSLSSSITDVRMTRLDGQMQAIAATHPAFRPQSVLGG